MSAREALARYHRRRDFSRTAEPEGRRSPPPGEQPSFVVQIHDARSMHFDFRLEADGVLKSFAVPKGPSKDPHDKRFATPTEDHPLEYREFEGVIPRGEYGGGTVIVWDEGTYRNLSSGRDGQEIPLARALEKGHASFWLDGRKLHGGYSLTRFRADGDGSGDGREAWLLVKHADERAVSEGTPDPRRARSARTGRTLGQVAVEAARQDGERE
ncbi:3'-phosphoesterase [Streptomyces sp. ISL-66]|uniref:DNA polymerase ligase N-terminal domain-containing protein n=1 Tax=Streptomyces sp. ISL-66 TaxID=2819186 RepID=UPI001BE889F4|nr:DNA polymerase ligase N-terminal domain-containing protein [Streptomyces sp. ISL-66]MBT2467745.1 3'-phosphoesterase [Streptomyces sp. ISL-66]